MDIAFRRAVQAVVDDHVRLQLAHQRQQRLALPILVALAGETLVFVCRIGEVEPENVDPAEVVSSSRT